MSNIIAKFQREGAFKETFHKKGETKSLSEDGMCFWTNINSGFQLKCL